MTPTREQVIGWAEEAGAIQLHEEGWGPVIQGSIGDMQRFVVLAMERAHAAGRDQGLREAKDVCEGKALASALAHVNTDEQAFHIKAEAARSCAAAIEQLRGK